MADRVGQHLGNYQLSRLLGTGGFAEVYLGEHLYLKTPAAIKLLQTTVANEEDLQAFLTEAQTIAQLVHPHIVRVLDFGVDGHIPFLVMDYAPGGTLRHRHPKGTRLPLTTIISYIKQAAEALQYAHEEKFIHRDVKPENMLVGRRDTILLSDFGIALIAQSSRYQSTQEVIGTVAYMAPEQIQGKPRPASDQYALAIVVYEWLSGDRPFHGSFTELCTQQMFAIPPSLHEKVPQISPSVEQVVMTALAKDPKQRFGSMQAFANALQQASQSEQTTFVKPQPLPFASPAAESPVVSSPAPPTQSVGGSLPPATPAAPPSQPTRRYGKPQRLFVGNKRTRTVLLCVLAIFLIFGVASLALNLTHHAGRTSGSTPAATTTPIPSLPNGIGVTKASDGEYIGISDGTFAFDTNRPDGRFKTQAAEKLKAGDVGDVNSAQSFWQSGLASDTNDAEALIYLEDQRVLTSGNPYITLVVATMLTGDNVGVGRDDLQGAYIAQKEFNDGHKLPNNVQVRLLIANSGNVATYATNVAQQIVQAAQQDHSIVGVMGWPFSSRTVNAVGVLAKAHIPMVSQTASSDQLTGASPYFFRVAPSNKGQAIAEAHYAEQVLHAHNVALFVDPADSYSSSLANDFSQQFLADGNHIVVTENYTVGSQGQGKLPSLLQDALSHNPDLIYFSGYSTDISVLLTNLPTTGQFANLQVLGGDGLYEVGGYSSSARANFTRLHFTAFAYPDEWGGTQQPPFFNEYIHAFNPNGQQPGGKYGNTRPSSDVMLSYDATLALLTGTNKALTGTKSSITTTDLRNGLIQINSSSPLQGVTGPIEFGGNGDPINKPLVILTVDMRGRIHLDRLQGCLLVGPCS